MDSNQEYYKDLVQIFVDGETTEVENAVLFQSLAQNEYLQQELQSAVRFGKVMQESSKSHRVPPDLYSSVMDTVGFGTAQVVSKTGTVLSYLKSIALISLGALATFGIMRYTSKEDNTAINASIQSTQLQKHDEVNRLNSSNNSIGSKGGIQQDKSNRYSGIQNTENGFNSPNYNASQKKYSVSRSNAQSNGDNESHLNTPSVYKNTDRKYSGSVNPQLASIQGGNTQNGIFIHPDPLNTNSPSIVESVIKYNETTENLSEPEEARMGISHVNLLSISSAPVAPPMSSAARTPLGVQEIDGTNEKSWFIPRFVSLRGMMGIIRTANTMDANALTLTPDVSLGDIAADASWSISENTSLGVEVGSERLPLYSVQKVDGVSSYVLKNNITWAALKCRLDYRPNLLNFLLPNANDMWYTSSLSVGFSDAGLLLKSQQMLTYNFYDRYHISVGPEFTFQLISNNNTYQSALRSGLGVGLGYEF